MYQFYRFMYGLVGFSRSQTNGFLLFLPLLLGLLFSEPVYRRYFAAPAIREKDIQTLDSLVALLQDYPSRDSTAMAFQTSRAAFDPNTASLEVLTNAGLNPGVARRLISFRAKGGKFRRKRDLLRVYGLDSATFLRIETLVLLPDTFQAARKLEFSRPAAQPKLPMKEARQELNHADTASLKKIKGIGDKLALRIIRFREGLGGFVSMDQLKDVYKLDPAVVMELNKRFYIPDEFIPKKLNINTAGRQQLATHPYINSKTADAIVAYRFQHGSFKVVEDLRNVQAVDSVTFRKLLPYLEAMIAVEE